MSGEVEPNAFRGTIVLIGATAPGLMDLRATPLDASIPGVGEVLLGTLPGRTSRDDVTVFESLGIAVEDLAAAHAIHRRAVETGAGVWLDWGGRVRTNEPGAA
jgi:ornithine cyclodeaminase/alanine dehydrogenase-like protein (mu-crystallin family)